MGVPSFVPAADAASFTAAAAESSPGNGEPPSQFGHTEKPVPATGAAPDRTNCLRNRMLLSILNFDTPPFLCYTKDKKTILSDSMVHLGNDWDEILAGEFEQDYYKRIRYWLKKRNTPSRPSIRRQRTSLTLCGTRRIPRSRPSSSGRTHITVPDRRTDFASRFSRVFSRLRACRTSSRNCRVISALYLPRTARSPSGRSAVCSC